MSCDTAPRQTPAVTIHGLGDARRAVSYGHALVLLSAPGAAGTLGAGWWRALIGRVSAAAPGLLAGDILDCGDAAGQAMAALRLGQRRLILDAALPSWERVASAARTHGAMLLAERPASFDMAAFREETRPRATEARLRAWLLGP